MRSACARFVAESSGCACVDVTGVLYDEEVLNDESCVLNDDAGVLNDDAGVLNDDDGVLNDDAAL